MCESQSRTHKTNKQSHTKIKTQRYTNNVSRAFQTHIHTHTHFKKHCEFRLSSLFLDGWPDTALLLTVSDTGLNQYTVRSMSKNWSSLRNYCRQTQMKSDCLPWKWKSYGSLQTLYNIFHHSHYLRWMEERPCEVPSACLKNLHLFRLIDHQLNKTGPYIKKESLIFVSDWSGEKSFFTSYEDFVCLFIYFISFPWNAAGRALM